MMPSVYRVPRRTGLTPCLSVRRKKTASAFRGPMAGSENNSVTLISGNYLSARLRSRNIFHQYELAAIPISSLLTKQHEQLQRKCDLAINVLM
jgi:hypothetical protein